MPTNFRSSLLIVTLLCTGPAIAINHEYATEKWWDGFWGAAQGWGEPNERVTSLLEQLDGTKQTISIVDVGAGNGRNSVLALEKLFKDGTPKSRYYVCCIDYSQEALDGLRSRPRPDWLELIIQKSDLNAAVQEDTFPKADLFLLYGVLECIKDENVETVLKMASRAVNPCGFLLFVTLVQGKGALEVEREYMRPESVVTLHLEQLKNLHFVDPLAVNIKYDCHDLGKGYPEDHIHYVYRCVMSKAE